MKKQNLSSFSLGTLLLMVLAAFGSTFAFGAEYKINDEFKPEGVKEVVFAVRRPSHDGHWYANFGYYALSDTSYPFSPNAGGRLSVINLDTGKVRNLINDPNGSVRDPAVHYDAQKIVFSYIPGGDKHYHLFEINVDGTGLRQLTFGPWDDIEPCYLPNDDIVFCSSRAKRWVQCWLAQVANIYRCGPNGENIRPLSCNMEQDNTPWVLNNGQLIYMRWEYVDRNEVSYHHLWTMNPDGERQNVFFGNQRPGITMIDAKPIPDSDRVIALFSSGHGHREHYGEIYLVDAKHGPDDDNACYRVPHPYLDEKDKNDDSKTNDYADPWAFSEDLFMAAHYRELHLIHPDGECQTFYSLPQEDIDAERWVHEPRPIVRHEREPIIPDDTDLSKETGTLMVADIYAGRRMKDVPRGTVKELLVLETLPKPIHYSGWMEQMSHIGTFTLERILGTVPVTPEGAAYFELPAMRSVLFIALDHDGKAVKRMHSFTSVMPGESQSCVGCHEDRSETTSNEYNGRLFDLTKAGPSKIQPIEGVPQVFDYPRDIQPIWDRHCLECHNPHRREGGVNLSGDWAPLYTNSYMELGVREMFGDNRNRRESDFPPYTIGSCASTLYRLIEENHGNANLSDLEKNIVRYWLEAGANYAGTYASNATGQIGWYYIEVNQEDDKDWPETKAMDEAVNRRCGSCHPDDDGPNFIPRRLSEDQPGLHLLKAYIKRNLVFDLTKPEDSLMLLAPLAKSAGGNEICRPRGAEGTQDVKPIFESTDDPDYQTILAGIERGRQYILNESNRHSMERFVPAPSYVREMKRFGILPPDHDPKTPINPFEVEERYWQSLQHHPADYAPAEEKNAKFVEE